MGTTSATHTAKTPPEAAQASQQQAVHIQESDSQQPVQMSQAATDGQRARNEGFSFSGERLRIVKAKTDGVRPLKAGKQSPTSMTENVVRDEGQARTVVTPLSLQATQFLQPLVGIDVDSIPIYRDTTAGQVTDAYHADALTVGGRVEVAASHHEDTPETLGLLAHELTHVARQREPGFIPPIARTPSDQPSVTGEEALAQRVEGRVRRTAQERIDRMESLASESIQGSEALPTTGMNSTSMPRSPGGSESWGGLPAPWEPLPDWFTAQPPVAENGVPYVSNSAHAGHLTGGMPFANTSGGENQASPVGTPGRAYAGDAGDGFISTSDGPMQRAGVERGSDHEETRATAQSAMDTLKVPEPDLDALAQQVYTRLKRRLGVEYRREG